MSEVNLLWRQTHTARKTSKYSAWKVSVGIEIKCRVPKTKTLFVWKIYTKFLANGVRSNEHKTPWSPHRFSLFWDSWTWLKSIGKVSKMRLHVFPCVESLFRFLGVWMSVCCRRPSRSEIISGTSEHYGPSRSTYCVQKMAEFVSHTELPVSMFSIFYLDTVFFFVQIPTYSQATTSPTAHNTRCSIKGNVPRRSWGGELER